MIDLGEFLENNHTIITVGKIIITVLDF